MAKIVFYCNDDRSHLETFEYYKQDTDALRVLGHDVVICTKYREIPASFDAMFIWWWNYALWPATLCRLRAKPCVITGVFNFRFPANYDGTDFHARPLWQRTLIQNAARLATLNLYIDEAEQKACAAHFSLANTRHYPCVTHADYLQGPATSRRMELFTLAWSGRQNLIRKGIPELLRAVRLLKDAGVPVRLNLAGSRGDGADDLVALVKELAIEADVALLGPLSRERKIELLRTCEVYVQPSHYEGFGVAIAEAMGSGACVVTCDVGAVRTVVGDCGIYAPPGDPQALATALTDALTNEALRHRLQRDALARARARFAPDQKVAVLRGYLAEAGIR